MYDLAAQQIKKTAKVQQRGREVNNIVFYWTHGCFIYSESDMR